jgi:FkbM family methyltransferase
MDIGQPGLPPEMAARLFWGMYEKTELQFVKAHLRRDLHVVELGAGLGFITLHIAALQNSECHVISVEANHRLIPLIEWNLRLNGFHEKVTILNQAVDYNGARTFFITANPLLSSLNGNRGGERIRVETVTLGHIISRFGLKEYCLVADIEGAEAAFILADHAALERCQQMIIELHNAEFRGSRYSIEELRASLTERHSFRQKAVRGGVYVFER